MSPDNRNLPLDELAEIMAGCQPNSMNDQKAKAEFVRRQSVAIQESAAATRKYALYMFISVVLLLISVVGQLLFNYLDYVNQR